MQDSNGPLTLQPGESTELTVIIHAASPGTHELCLMFIFRKVLLCQHLVENHLIMRVGRKPNIFLGEIIQALCCWESIRYISHCTPIFVIGPYLHRRTRSDECVLSIWRPNHQYCLCESPMEMPVGTGKYAVSPSFVNHCLTWLSYLPRDNAIPSQCFRLLFGATPWLDGKGSAETFNFVSKSVKRLLKGNIEDDHSLPPPIDLLCSDIYKVCLVYVHKY